MKLSHIVIMTVVVFALLFAGCDSMGASGGGDTGAGDSGDAPGAIEGIWQFGSDFLVHVTDTTFVVETLSSSDGTLDVTEGSLEYCDADTSSCVVLFDTYFGESNKYVKFSWSPDTPDSAPGTEITLSFYTAADDLAAAIAVEELTDVTVCRVQEPWQELEYVQNFSTDHLGSITWDANTSRFFLSHADATVDLHSSAFANLGEWKDTTIIHAPIPIHAHAVSFNGTDGSVVLGLRSGVNQFSAGIYKYDSIIIEDASVPETPNVELTSLSSGNVRRVAHDSSGNIFAIESENGTPPTTGTIRRYSSSLEAGPSFEITASNFTNNGFTKMNLQSIRVDNDDRVYVCIDVDGEPDDDDDGYDAVLRFSNDLTAITGEWGGGGGNVWRFNGPSDIAFDGENNMYVVSRWHNGVSVYDVDDDKHLLRGYIVGPDEGSAEPGKLGVPTSIEVVGDKAYITEAAVANKRVSIFRTLE